MRLGLLTLFLVLAVAGSAGAARGDRKPVPHAGAGQSGFGAYIMVQDFVSGLAPGDTYEAVWTFTPTGEPYYSLSAQTQTVSDAGVAQFNLPLPFLNNEHEAGTLTTWVEVPTMGYDGVPIMTDNGPATATFQVP